MPANTVVTVQQQRSSQSHNHSNLASGQQSKPAEEPCTTIANIWLLGSVLGPACKTGTATAANINATSVDLTGSLDKIAKMLPLLVIILVAAIAIGHIKGGKINIGGA